MKKLFAVLTIAAAMAACNNTAETTRTEQDSIDSVNKSIKPVETPTTPVDTSNKMKDTTHAKDTAKVKK